MKQRMQRIRFELHNDIEKSEDSDPFIFETSMDGGVHVEDYLIPFKAFLYAMGYQMSTVEEITTKEQAILDWQEENKNCHLTDE